MSNEHHDLAAGASYYNEEQHTVYYRGDGANTSVSLPDEASVASIIPSFDYSLYPREDGTRFVIFAEAIKIGVIVEIVLNVPYDPALNGVPVDDSDLFDDDD
jgi:hypothetical protein